MMRWPRLHLVHQLALLLTAAAVLSIAITGGFTVWNLRTGFSEYMRLRDQDAVEQLSRVIAQRAAQDPSMEWLRRNREAYRTLLRSAGIIENAAPRGEPEHPVRPPRRDSEFVEDRAGVAYARPPPHGPAYGSIHIADRINIVDADGQHVGGRPQPKEARQSIYPIKVGETIVARILLTDAPQPTGIDAAFLRRQITGLAWAALGTVLLALLAAWVIAKHWSRPLRAVQNASQRIAQGDRQVSLVPQGAVEVVALMTDINQMAQSLSRLENARKLWLAHLSHELRTPLSVLRGELESIEDGARKPTPTVIHSLQQEVLQLSRLIDDLHTLATHDMQGLACQFTDGDVSAWMPLTLARWTSSAASQRLHIELRPPQRINDEIPHINACWDWSRMDQVMANLITNSLRYTDAPGRIEISLRETKSHIEIIVDDSAPGVASSDKDALFEPLFRVDASRQRHQQPLNPSAPAQAQASGLGLSIVRAIIQTHQGYVYAEDSPLGGLRIVMQLPPHPQKTQAP
jgi:two-component system, OmpR family, sensor histidine kinase BaeS